MPDTTTETRAAGPVVETVTRLILHCSRCNTPFKDDDYDTVVCWEQTGLDKTFPASFSKFEDVQGWIRLGDRILCFDCWTIPDDEDETRVECPPLSAADADKVAREQLIYQQQVVTQ